MLPTTIKVIRATFEADPSIDVPERTRLLALLRNGNGSKPKTEPSTGPRLLNRRAAAAVISKSTRTIDNLAAKGILKRRFLPGRQRSCGFLESDLLELLS